MTTYNDIYLRRSRRWMVTPDSGRLPRVYLATAMHNIEGLGYTFTPRLREALSTLSPAQFNDCYQQMLSGLRGLVGARVTYEPMYPGFPEQVMELEDAELYLNAILHYYTGQMPEDLRAGAQALPERQPMEERAQPKAIDLGELDHFYGVIRQLLEANSSLSVSDQEDLETVLALTDQAEQVLPAEIPFRENVGFVAGVLLRCGKASADRLAPYMKTATDVLRLAAALSGGDVSLAAHTRLRSFKRRERRLLLALLEACASPTEDMLRHKKRWLRLGEILHPGEHKSRYPACWEAFDTLRNDRPFETFHSRVEVALRWHNAPLAAELLAARPGEYARRMDHLLRVHPEPWEVVLHFSELASEVATPLLLQVMAYFSHRGERREWRTFFPKGIVGKAFSIKNSLPDVDGELCRELVELSRQALLARFSALPALGKVYLDEGLQSYTVPTGLRSASKSLRTLSRGSRLPMPDGETIRLFLWWKEGEVRGQPTGRVDVDLSAVIYDEHWQYKEHISYTHLRSSAYRAVHSGDIVSAPKGACEFIDIDIPSVLWQGGRYVVASLNSFTEQPYCELPECYAGWMMRRRPGSGEVFEPATVVDRVDLAADTQIAIPVILDLVEHTVIWCDLALKRQPMYYNNVEGNQSGMVAMGRAMTSLVKPSLYDLFELHALARGELMGSPAEAETIFAPGSGVTPFEIERILAEFMA